MLRSGLVGLVDVELSDGPQFFEPIVNTAHRHDANVIVSFHDFDKTPSNETLLGTIAEMVDPEIARDHFALALFRQDASEKAPALFLAESLLAQRQ